MLEIRMKFKFLRTNITRVLRISLILKKIFFITLILQKINNILYNG